MKYHKVCVPLIAACVFLSLESANASGSQGMISFHGSVTQPTAVPVITAGIPTYTDPGTAVRMEPLTQARARLSSDLLDYFAQYAKPHAKLVSVAYQ